MEVAKIAIERALKLLKAANCKYCIIEENGTKHGELEVVETKAKKRAPSRFGRGTMQDYYLPFLKDVEPGKMILVPYGKFGVDVEARSALRGAITSWCSLNWGKKTYITHNSEKGVEILRE